MRQIKEALVAAGVEVYRTRADEIHLAERIRLHIMDSGVRVRVAPTGTRVSFVARSQRSDAPDLTGDNHFARVRRAIGETVTSKGYSETAAVVVEVKDPSDATRVLDVWHEVTYEKPVEGASLVDEVRWALGLEKNVVA